jgi:hypothetical protein
MATFGHKPAKLGQSVKKDFMGIGSKLLIEKVKIRNYRVTRKSCRVDF